VDFYFSDTPNNFAGDFDVAREVAAMSIVKEIVDRKGGWIYYGERKWQGQDSFVASLREEVDLLDELRDRVLSIPDAFVGATDGEA
jgi:hypothetical protein